MTKFNIQWLSIILRVEFNIQSLLWHKVLNSVTSVDVTLANIIEICKHVY